MTHPFTSLHTYTEAGSHMTLKLGLMHPLSPILHDTEVPLLTFFCMLSFKVISVKDEYQYVNNRICLLLADKLRLIIHGPTSPQAQLSIPVPMPRIT